jgi:hypothetical protein
MLKINYKFEANNSKKFYYLFCYLYVEVTEIIKSFLLVSGKGKCQDHYPSQPSHIHNETSVSVQLKHSSYWSNVIFCCSLKLKFRVLLDVYGDSTLRKLSSFVQPINERTGIKRSVTADVARPECV